ncbi:MAG: tyrosine recombinase [Ruminococcaceae bacterium]|nr:tyrosine recombinase [Oscillospiraceae bacterium]
MQDFISSFENYLTNEKKSSKNTLDSYLRDIGQFSTYCKINGITDLSQVDTSVIDRYFEYLNVLGKSQCTVTRVAASLRCYFNFLSKNNLCNINPIIKVKKTAAEKRLPEILTGKEVLNLLAQPSGTDYKSIRDKAMLELLYATGIKVSELIEVKLTDINLQIGILVLTGSKNERIIPIYPAAIKTLSTYINSVRPAIISDMTEERLFTNMSGEPLSRQGFWKIVKYYAQKSKIKKDITPHTLRHSFAAHLLENGANLKDIKEMLGHADISTTQIYAQLMKNKYTQDYNKFHPLAR